MRGEGRGTELAEADAGLIAGGLFQGEALLPEVAGRPGAAESRGAFKKTSLLHAQGAARVLVVGLGKRGEVAPERLRVVAAMAAKEAERLEATSIAWAPPNSGHSATAAEALVVG